MGARRLKDKQKEKNERRKGRAVSRGGGEKERGGKK